MAEHGSFYIKAKNLEEAFIKAEEIAEETEEIDWENNTCNAVELMEVEDEFTGDKWNYGGFWPSQKKEPENMTKAEIEERLDEIENELRRIDENIKGPLEYERMQLERIQDDEEEEEK